MARCDDQSGDGMIKTAIKITTGRRRNRISSKVTFVLWTSCTASAGQDRDDEMTGRMAAQAETVESVTVS